MLFRNCIIIIALLLSGKLTAQDNIMLKFHFTFKGKPVVFRDSAYITPEGDTISIDVCKMYLSNFRLLQNHQEVYKENYSYHIINPIRNRDSIPLRGIKNKFDEIEFCIGVDSLTNTLGVMTGDLDPVNAMYWAWNSGYINAKLEGSSSACNTPQNRFEYHIGGYLAPYQSIQKVNLPFSVNYIKKKNTVILNADLSTWFTGIKLNKDPGITTPSAKAVMMAKNYASMFSIVP